MNGPIDFLCKDLIFRIEESTKREIDEKNCLTCGYYSKIDGCISIDEPWKHCDEPCNGWSQL